MYEMAFKTSIFILIFLSKLYKLFELNYILTHKTLIIRNYKGFTK